MKMEEVILSVEKKEFKVKKDVLCEQSDYFKAMFSGNYVENQQDIIEIDVVDANSMELIVRYMKIGLIDLTELPLSSMKHLASSSSFLQIVELLKQIEFTLELNLSKSNWLETSSIAQVASFFKLEKYSAAYGLLSFDQIKTNCIPSVAKLFWYLSHPYLNTHSELEVFRFGLEWMIEHSQSADLLLVILGCLDVKVLTKHDLIEIKKLIRDYDNSLASRVVECLLEISSKGWELSSAIIAEQKEVLCQMFSTGVFNEVISLVRGSRSRSLKFVPCVCAFPSEESPAERGPHYLYTYKEEKGLAKWLEIAEKNLWGWSVTSWGPHRLVVAGGEYGRGTGNFNKDVAVYDTLKQEWTRHGAVLPAVRHAGVIVHENQLYVIGGIGSFRIILSSTIVYDLEQRSRRMLKNLPDALQNPAVCIHKGQIYVASQTDIFKYEESEESNQWTHVLFINMRASYMVSIGDYIYITQNYFGQLFRFRPGEDNKLDLFTHFSNPVATMCSVGNKIISFTQTACGQIDMVAVEEYNSKDDSIKVLWSSIDGLLSVNDAVGCCTLVMAAPPIDPVVSSYPNQYLARFNDD